MPNAWFWCTKMPERADRSTHCLTRKLVKYQLCHSNNQFTSPQDYLHGRGVAHRDIKPENLLLTDDDVLKISDFGLATVFRYKGKERPLEKRCGTIPYMAPEVLQKPNYAAESADIWSCGVVLLAMLTGGESQNGVLHIKLPKRGDSFLPYIFFLW